jgi:organic hydroperoxide reductase OsmC/OhrA
MSKQSVHEYRLELSWAGDTATGYLRYPRDHEITITGKPTLALAADPAFLGDPSRHNPEDLLLAALSSCHLLSYLALAAKHRVQVLGYSDQATGTMTEDGQGGGRFTDVTLRPRVVVAEPGQLERAGQLHADANRLCFIAQSVNFPVHHDPTAVLG